MAYAIVTDSCCNLAKEEVLECELTILPLTFYVDGESNLDDPMDPKTDLKKFYDDMRAGKVVSTSLPNLADSQKKFKALLDEGNDILYLGFSSALSGTFEATSNLLNQLSEEYPERTLISIDTLAAAGGQGLIVYLAAQMKKSGSSLEEVAAWVRDNLQKSAHWFTVDDLVYLFRGGRVSKTSAWAGTLLNIKPVLHVDHEGRLIPVEKVRGRKKSLSACIKAMEKNGFDPASDAPILINHGDCIEDALWVKEEIEKQYGADHKFIITELGPVIGAHAGPGTIALFFMNNCR